MPKKKGTLERAFEIELRDRANKEDWNILNQLISPGRKEKSGVSREFFETANKGISKESKEEKKDKR